MKQNEQKGKDRNPDPITDEPGAHPVGVGLGTAAGGAAAGAAAGAVAGPVGVVAGAVLGGVAGGLAGKGVAELVDPTAEDAYWKENFKSRPYIQKGAAFEEYQPAYRYGAQASTQHAGRSFEQVESNLAQGWTKARGACKLSWDQARPAARDAFDRTIKLHEERLNVQKQPVQRGEVRVRKEVVSEHQMIDVPVEREEVVIERRPVGSKASTSGIQAEEIRIPVKEEQVNVSKETVVKEEVNVGKRKVQDTKQVSGTVRKEEMHVEKEGDVNVQGSTKTKP